MRKIKVKEGHLVLEDQIEVVYEKMITRFGNGAKIDAPKKYIGKKAYVLIKKS